MKAEKSKRNFWTNSEIDCMLSLIKLVRLTNGSTGTTHYTFVAIASKMKKRGFPNKSPTQIRRKWFQMKSAYLCFKRGKTERLLLIPERFRSVIAEFVEADLNSGKQAIQLATEAPPEIIKEVLTRKEGIVKNVAAVRKEPIIRMEPIMQKEPVVAKTQTIKKDQPIKKDPPIKVNQYNNKVQLQETDDFVEYKGASKNPFYDDKFAKLMTHIKQSHSFVSAEFQKMQEDLMSYEQNCQKIRDSKLIEFMDNITYKNTVALKMLIKQQTQQQNNILKSKNVTR